MKWRVIVTAAVLAVAAIDIATGQYRSAVILAVMAALVFVVAGVNAVLTRRFGPVVQMGWGAVFIAGWAALLWVLAFTDHAARVLTVVGAVAMTASACMCAFITYKAAHDSNLAEHMEQGRQARAERLPWLYK
jgi:hypothetical protein